MAGSEAPGRTRISTLPIQPCWPVSSSSRTIWSVSVEFTPSSESNGTVVVGGGVRTTAPTRTVLPSACMVRRATVFSPPRMAFSAPAVHCRTPALSAFAHIYFSAGIFCGV